MEVYIVQNCLDQSYPITCNSFKVAEQFACQLVEKIESCVEAKNDTISRNDMVWSFSNGIVVVYIQRVYLGRFHTDVLQLDKKMDVLLSKIEPSTDFIKKLDELLNMKIIVASK